MSSAPDLATEKLLAEVQTLRERVAHLERTRPTLDLLGLGVAETQSFLSQLLHNAPAPIYMTSLDGRLLFVNRAWEELFRLSREQVLGRFGAEVILPQDAQRFLAANSQVVAADTSLTLEEFTDTPDGRRYYQTVKFPVREAVGRVIAVGGVSIDVTECKRAAVRYRELLEESPDGIAVVRDGVLAYVNSTFCALLGYNRPEELIGQDANHVLAADSQERVVNNSRARAGGLPVPSRAEIEYRHRDGHTVPAEVYIRIIEFDGVLSSLSHISDITERKKAEAALSDSEARLRRFFDAAFEGIVLHENGIIIDANRVFADMYGYAPEEMIGKHAVDFTAVESRALLLARIAAGDERPYEGFGLRKDGSTFPVEVCGKNIEYQGRPVRVTALRDLTERKQTQELLRQSAERLESLSHRLLQVQEEERRSLALELHDEVGQTLTGLQLTLELGERLNDEGLRDKVRAARGLVRDLTGRIRELSLRLRPTLLDDLGLLPALLWHFRRYTDQTGVQVLFTHRGLEQRFAAEQELAVYRVVQEALTNVARHANVSVAAVCITLDNSVVRLEIADRGAGFDPEAVQTAGMGCGLSGLRQRVTLLGGRFTVVSTPGVGTCIRAELPGGERESDGSDDCAGR